MSAQVRLRHVHRDIERRPVRLRQLRRVYNAADIFTDQIHVFLTALNQNLIALLFIY